jgi:hypothetical protein
MLRAIVSRSVCLGVKHSSGAYDQIFIIVRKFWVCWCGTLSLTRELVCCLLQLLLILTSAVILWSKSRWTHDHILLSQIRDPSNLEGQVPVFISPRNRVAQLYPQALGYLFVASYNLQGYGGGIRTRLHAGMSVSSVSHLLKRMLCQLKREHLLEGLSLSVHENPSVRTSVCCYGNNCLPMSLQWEHLCPLPRKQSAYVYIVVWTCLSPRQWYRKPGYRVVV